MVYRNKQYVPVSGEKLVHFNDIVIPGTPKLADLLPRIMEGFDTTMAPAYDARYLAGWPAEVYETAMSDASLNARQQAVRRTRELIRGEMGHVSDLNYSTSSLAILSFKLVLVPVWITSIPLEGRDYRVLINGMMGNVYGETPSHGVLGFINNILGT
jgi:hypothetical protein